MQRYLDCPRLLAVFAIAVTTRAYTRADVRLREYAKVLDHLPEGADVCYVDAWRAAYVGTLAPFAIFHGYHYLEHSGGVADYAGLPAAQRDEDYLAYRVGNVPQMTGFVGTLRTVHDSRIVDQPGPARIDRILARPDIGPGGIAVLLSGAQRPEVRAAAARHGFETVLQISDAELLQRRDVPEPASHTDRFDRDFCDRSDYLVLLHEPGQDLPSLARGFTPVLRRGSVALMARREPGNRWTRVKS